MKIRTAIKGLTIVAIVFLVIPYFFLYIWFHNSIDKVLTLEQQKWLITEMNNSPELPDNVYQTLEKYYPDFYAEGTWNYKLKSAFELPIGKCQCNDLYLPYIPYGNAKPMNERHWIPLDQGDLVMKLFIERHFSQKECFTFNMNTSSFGSNTRSMAEAAQHYFHKKLDELTEREVIGLYIMHAAPTRYSPRINKERHDARVDEVMNRIN